MLLSVGGLSVLQEAVGDRIPVLLLGNKIDNEKEREVPRGLGEKLAKVKSKLSISLDRVRARGQSGKCPRALVGAFPGSPLGRKQVDKMGVLASWEWHVDARACGTFCRKSHITR